MLYTGNTLRVVRTIGTLAFCIAAITCAACSGGPKDVRYRPRELSLHGNVWPPDIVASRPVIGVFTVDVQQSAAGLCCWAAPHASFSVAKPHRARELVIGLYVPDVDAFRKRSQSVTVALPRFRQAKTFTGLGAGFHMLHLPLIKPVQSRTGAQTITLDSKYVFMPTGSQGPRYGVLLLSAYFD